jgi:membrane-bound lytic murein transglycosylase D
LSLLRSITITLPVIWIAAAAGSAGASAFGPDMPGWSQSGPAQASSPSDSHPAESDPLTPVRAKLARAEGLAHLGDNTQAYDLADEALDDLRDVPSSGSGAVLLRERLEDLRDRCSRTVDDEADVADGASTDTRKLGPVEAERNDRVDAWIDYYTGRGRDRFQLWITRSASYMDLLTKNLRAEGVPEELANLVFVESGFNMHAKSVARAVGPWQFIRGTARLFGLEMTPYKDERRDPELATRAAARYLRRLYEMFDGSWPLALAAYNSGEGTVQRAIKRQQTTDFWELRLPRETKDYVPKFLAAMEIASDPQRYGFEVPENSPLRYDQVLVEGAVDLKEVARVGGVEVSELERLNPSFVRHRAPGDKDGTALKVPHGMGEDVQLALDTTYNPKPLTKTEIRTATREHRAEIRQPVRRRGRSGTHIVRRGETLSQIGQRYGTSANRLVELNGLSSASQIRAGQRIRVR